MVEMSPYSAKLPAEVVAAAEEVRKAIVDGTLHPFAGPINDQKGMQKVAAGETVSDNDLLGMDWYVEGVSA
jgi:simple sugar transport system substrate-binding protein